MSYRSVFLVFSVVLHLTARQLFFRNLDTMSFGLVGQSGALALGAVELFAMDAFGAFLGNICVSYAAGKKVEIKQLILSLSMIMLCSDGLILLAYTTGIFTLLRGACLLFGVSRALFHLGFASALGQAKNTREKNSIQVFLEMVIASTTVILPMVVEGMQGHSGHAFFILYLLFAVMMVGFLFFFNQEKIRRNSGRHVSNKALILKWTRPAALFEVMAELSGQVIKRLRQVRRHEVCVFLVVALLQMSYSMGVSLSIEWQIESSVFAHIILMHGVGIGVSALLCINLNNHIKSQLMGLLSWLIMWFFGVFTGILLGDVWFLMGLYGFSALAVPPLLANLRVWMIDEEKGSAREYNVANRMALFGIMETLGMMGGALMVVVAETLAIGSGAGLMVLVFLLFFTVIGVFYRVENIQGTLIKS